MGMKYFILMTTTINLAIHTIHPMTKHPRKHHLVIYNRKISTKYETKLEIRNKNTVTKKKIGNSKCNIRNV